MSRPRIAILGQDLVWADRLARAVDAAGGDAVRVRTTAELERAVPAASHAIVDLTAHAYDGVASVGAARGAGARVLAVGPHDDLDLRKRALAAGAERVLAYRKLFEDGAGTIERWLAGSAPADAATPGDAAEEAPEPGTGSDRGAPATTARR
jgi:hypothetical protein